MISPRLGELLLARELINTADLDKALLLQQQIGGRLGALLIRIGALSEDSLLPVLAEQLEMPLLDADELLTLGSAWLEQTGVELNWWIDQEVLAWETGSGAIRCVARDPLNPALSEAIERIFPGRALEWRLARSHDLERALDLLSRSNAAFLSGDATVAHLRELAEEAPVIEFVNNLLSQAFEARASDIHIEPEETVCMVRYRIDGILYTRFNLPRDRFNAIASRIKLISGMDIAERRLPQDGRLGARVSGSEVDIRVSALPGVHGESIVMRLLPKERQDYRLDRLGLEDDHLELLSRLIQEPHGILLVTGPTGSGKSTTLYAALEAVNDRKRKVITVEDPVEYQLAGITQIQAHAEIGYTFARALRAILRQDPDIIMIGEIRDQETAEIAVQASLTGHLVLSTLHTNDALSAFTRLIDMGVEPFLVATPIRAVMAQRLVRRLCPACAAPVAAPAFSAEIQQALPPAWRDAAPQWRQAVGCPACQGTGYRGRVGIYELVEVSPPLQTLILKAAPLEELRELTRQQGWRSLRGDGFLKAWQGRTSLDEVLRVTAQ
ncbi:MAG: Flp pilus assembly complex ATPase component TadA [Gammaproteobacteria bacterium]|nr:Flp pilus assembly complex ATPase component TadA [Gammaproteobacteria bacterium]